MAIGSPPFAAFVLFALRRHNDEVLSKMLCFADYGRATGRYQGRR